MNRLAVCLGLHTTHWYCAASSQTNSAFWVSALSVSMLHNQNRLSINRSSSDKYQFPPIDKHCVSPHTSSVSLHEYTLFPYMYTHCFTVHALNIHSLTLTHHTIICTFILMHLIEIIFEADSNINWDSRLLLLYIYLLFLLLLYHFLWVYLYERIT